VTAQMHRPGAERKLAAILAADVVGYSRLMQADDQATLQALTERRALFAERVTGHGGRIVNAPGDSILAEFASVVSAVQCALDVQRALAESNAGLTEPRRMQFRIGVNLGDVLVGASGIYGDGVNIAARLESLAAPGGICISSSVHDQVKNRLALEFEDLGERQVKNIAEPVRVFRIVLKAQVDAAGAIAKPKLALPDKPSLAVLAFTNMSGDPEQEYFADGVVDEIISALSRVRTFFVIARNSSFTYKGRAVDVKQVGRELGVRYVLEGSIRKAGNRVRIVGQLVEAENGRHIWADRFEGNLDDIFELQDRITESVVGAIEPNLRLAEIERARAKPTANLHAYDLCLRAMPNLMSNSTKLANDEVLGLLYRAIEMDPGYSLAKAMCAYTYLLRKAQSWATDVEIEEGLRLAEEALADHHDDPATLSYAGQSLSYLGLRHEEALHAIDRALTLNTNSARTLLAAGWVRGYVGDAAIAIEHFQRAMRLSPLDPAMAYVLAGLGYAYLIAGKYEDALSAGLKSLLENPRWTPSHRLVVVCLVQLGRLDEARVAANRIMELRPETTISAIRLQIAYKDQAFKERYISALRVAGIPE
jgi:adenylate cyclase